MSAPTPSIAMQAMKKFATAEMKKIATAKTMKGAQQAAMKKIVTAKTVKGALKAARQHFIQVYNQKAVTKVEKAQQINADVLAKYMSGEMSFEESSAAHVHLPKLAAGKPTHQWVTRYIARMGLEFAKPSAAKTTPAPPKAKGLRPSQAQK